MNAHKVNLIKAVAFCLCLCAWPCAAAVRFDRLTWYHSEGPDRLVVTEDACPSLIQEAGRPDCQPGRIEAVPLYSPDTAAHASLAFTGSYFASRTTLPAAPPAGLVLLPRPQQIQYLPGVHEIKPERFILLDTDSPDTALNIGRIVQQSLAKVGPEWQLTRAAGDDPRRIGAVVRIDPSQIDKPQGYRLKIDADRILIEAHDPPGAFYAAQTLRQICKQQLDAAKLTCLDVRDWPDFPNRGVLLDISRDKVPTMQTLYELVDLLSEWKINQLQLYTEHTFAYRNHSVVWENADPVTGEQIMALDARCRSRFIDLVPNQNSFAHMHRWLKHKEYLHLAERQDSPFSISPAVPGSIELLAALYDELLPHFSSRRFNVGCDETFDLGSGKSKEMCERLGKGRVYLNFLLKIHAQLQKHGRTMQFWGDIILHYPELIPELPKDITAMVWGYEADHPFDSQSRRFKASGVPFYVCPGTSTWNSIAGRTDNAVANLRNAAENGLANGATGYLNTNWGDNGHWQPLPVCYPGYAFGAAVSWAVAANKDIDLPHALDLHAFADRSAVMGRLVCDLGSAYSRPRVLLGNQSVLFYILQNPESRIDAWPYDKLTAERLADTREYIDKVMLPLSLARMDRPDARQISDELANAARLLRHACSLAMARLRATDGRMANIAPAERADLAADLSRIIDEHKRLWLLRNRPGGLSDSVARMESLLKMYRAP
jgi:hexosaminidase